MKAVVWMQWVSPTSPSFQTAALGAETAWAFSWKHSDAFSDVKESIALHLFVGGPVYGNAVSLY